MSLKPKKVSEIKREQAKLNEKMKKKKKIVLDDIPPYTFKVAWSNESLELWFVLHFQDLNTNVGRDKYIEILDKYCDYCKNDPNLFELMKANTDIAIIRAKKQYDAYPKDTPASQRCPATKVFELVEALKKYL